jgi:hypothetical protein
VTSRGFSALTRVFSAGPRLGWKSANRLATAWQIGWRVLAVVLGLSLGYLVLANALLQTRWLRGMVNEAPSVELEYSSASSYWPGRVRVTGLALQAEDYNVQFEVKLETATLDVSLHELMWRRFHVLALEAQGTSFRFRHKVHAVGENARRLAAYPPIAGFADPPLYAGAAPSGEDETKLWQVRIDNVHAEIAELWFVEHRYVGGGLAQGSFHVEPGRSFEVRPATLRLDGGQLKIGESVLVERLRLDAQASIERTDVDVTVGNEIFRGLDANIDAELEGVNPAAAGVYVREASGVEMLGRGSLRVLLRVAGGRLDPGGHAELDFADLEIRSKQAALRAAIQSRLRVNSDRGVELELAASRLLLQSGAERTLAALDGARAELIVNPAELDAAELQRVALQLPALDVPSLSRWTPLIAGVAPIELGGRLDGRMSAAWQRLTGASASVDLRWLGGELGHADLRVAAAGHFRAELEPRSGKSGTSEGRLDIDLDRVVLSRAGDRSAPFRASLRSGNVSVTGDPEPKLSATLHAVLEPARPLMHLLVGAEALRTLTTTLWGLDRLDAEAELSSRGSTLVFELSHAKSGSLEGQGELRLPSSGQASGAFLLTSGVGNVGVELRGSETKTELLVGDDWLEQIRAASGGQPGPGRRSLSSP